MRAYYLLMIMVAGAIATAGIDSALHIQACMSHQPAAVQIAHKLTYMGWGVLWTWCITYKGRKS